MGLFHKLKGVAIYLEGHLIFNKEKIDFVLGWRLQSLLEEGFFSCRNLRLSGKKDVGMNLSNI